MGRTDYHDDDDDDDDEVIIMVIGLGSVRTRRTHTSSPDSKPAGRGETPETWRRGQENQNLLIVIPLF